MKLIKTCWVLLFFSVAVSGKLKDGPLKPDNMYRSIATKDDRVLLDNIKGSGAPSNPVSDTSYPDKIREETNIEMGDPVMILRSILRYEHETAAPKRGWWFGRIARTISRLTRSRSTRPPTKLCSRCGLAKRPGKV